MTFKTTVEREKAEKYVREKLDLFITYAPNVNDVNSGEKLTLGQPIQLQHWLRCLSKDIDRESSFHLGDVHIAGISLYVQPDPNKDFFKFNLTTGQPATELDFQSFCDIMGI